MKICVFAYNFKHKKTQDGLLKLFLSKIKINQVIAMNKIKINQPYKKIEIPPKIPRRGFHVFFADAL